MKGVNDYWQQLSEEDIAAGKHRDFVGSLEVTESVGDWRHPRCPKMLCFYL